MKIIDCKNNDCHFINDVKKYKYQGDNSIMYKYKKFIIKEIKKNKKKEIKNIKLILYLFKKYKLRIFISSYYKLYLYEDKFYIFMKKYVDTIKWIKYKNINELKNIVQQCLLFCIFLNFEMKLFHNDFHLNNCVYKNIKNPIKIKFKDIELIIENKIVKIIDFDYLDKVNNQRHKQHFLKNSDIINNDVDYFLIMLFVNYRIKNNKVIKLIKKKGKLDEKRKFKFYFQFLYNIKNKLNIRNNLTDYLKFYKYIDSHFSSILSFELNT